MSRTKHTTPRRLRAPRRVRAPYQPRGYADPSAQHSLARLLKQVGLVADASDARPKNSGTTPLPRVIVKRARRGHFHPASRSEILSLLRFFGAEYTYGLRAVELTPGGHVTGADHLRLGTLVVPGRIVLYDQPPSPWLLVGGLAPIEQERLRRAGALVESIAQTGQTTVCWPGETLRDFMLFDVLMHEIGHHILQHYKGKRRVRLARTSDHEAFADRFARRCRLAYVAGQGALP